MTELIEKKSFNWEGPYQLDEFFLNTSLHEQYKCAGVYIWTLRDKKTGVKKIYYVGRAMGNPTLTARTLAHYVFRISALYTIPAEFRRNSLKWTPGDIGYDNYKNTLTDINEFKNLIEDAFDVPKYLSVYFHKQKREGKILENLERQLLYALQPEGTKMGRESMPDGALEFSQTYEHNFDQVKDNGVLKRLIAEAAEKNSIK